MATLEAKQSATACTKCGKTDKGFGDVCAECRKSSGSLGTSKACGTCGEFFTGYGSTCPDCTSKLSDGRDAVHKGIFGGQSLQHVFEAMKAALPPKTMGWLAWKYDNVVDAQEMLDYLEKQPFCKDREQAVKICTELQAQGAISHVWASNPAFRDQTMYFQYSAATPTLADMYDVVVIGAGTAGISATSFCAQFGTKCVMLEQARVGGDCTWSGCIPSKSLIKASHIVHGAAEAKKFGVDSGKPLADMKKVKDYVWDKINQVAEHDLNILKEKNVPLRYGKASFLDPHTLEFKTKEGEAQRIKSRSFILCLGAVAAPPPMKGLSDVPFHTYETIFDVDVLPKRMCVIGGGVIGCEMAQSFSRLGTEVTMVASALLPKEPKQVDKLLSEQFEAEGIKIVRGRGDMVEKIKTCDRVDRDEWLSGSFLRMTVKTKSGELVPIETDMLMVATGRRPNTQDMNLEVAGVKLDPKTKLISVTPDLQTTASHIYAAGDCCTLQQFTHYASQMGVWAARNLLLPGSNIPTHVVPRATFTEPEVASVGLTEDEARAQGFEVYSQASSKNERAICEADTRGFVDVYLDKAGMVQGACIMNNRAGEMLSEILVAMEHKIAFQDLSIRKVVHPYPTYSWATMMLATDVDGKKFDESTAASIAKWYVGR